jgi:hypothetical protein
MSKRLARCVQIPRQTTAAGSGGRAKCDLGHSSDHAFSASINDGLIGVLWVGEEVTVFDYVAIGVLIVLIVWAVADWVPRGKL